MIEDDPSLQDLYGEQIEDTQEYIETTIEELPGYITDVIDDTYDYYFEDETNQNNDDEEEK